MGTTIVAVVGTLAGTLGGTLLGALLTFRADVLREKRASEHRQRLRRRRLIEDYLWVGHQLHMAKMHPSAETDRIESLLNDRAHFFTGTKAAIAGNTDESLFKQLTAYGGLIDQLSELEMGKPESKEDALRVATEYGEALASLATSMEAVRRQILARMAALGLPDDE